MCLYSLRISLDGLLLRNKRLRKSFYLLSLTPPYPLQHAFEQLLLTSIVYVPTPGIWPGLMTCSDQQKVVK